MIWKSALPTSLVTNDYELKTNISDGSFLLQENLPPIIAIDMELIANTIGLFLLIKTSSYIGCHACLDLAEVSSISIVLSSLELVMPAMT